MLKKKLIQKIQNIFMTFIKILLLKRFSVHLIKKEATFMGRYYFFVKIIQKVNLVVFLEIHF